MNDVAPELYKNIMKEFWSLMQAPAIKRILKKVDENRATYTDGSMYAYWVGRNASKVMQKYLTSSALPDGKLYFNIAERTVRPLLEEAERLVGEVMVRIQDNINLQNGTNLNTAIPERLKGVL